MNIVLTYLIAVFINPIFLITLSIMLFPKILQESLSGILFQTAIAGFTSIWLGKTIFNFFELQPVPLIVFLIGSVFFVNYLLAFDFKDIGPILYNATILGLVGSLIGIFIGGVCFF